MVQNYGVTKNRPNQLFLMMGRHQIKLIQAVGESETFRNPVNAARPRFYKNN
jgi:hypothetical protein